ncbi:MAG TPA: metallophosphoesterase family protein [Enhygromyxa sp.]|nr:metallophosphoesterase family protein [Enhygromyxa sp.]
MPRRVAFISDLHANLVALDAALAELDELGVDEIICLGDIVDLGPQPQAVVDRLRERGVRCVRGNHDPLDEHPEHAMLAEIEAWTQTQLDDATLAELAGLPDQLLLDLAGTRVLCVHGSPRDFNDQVLDTTSAEQLLAWTSGWEFDVMVCGHTHVQLLRRIDRQVFVNVGSLGMPFARAFCGGTPQVLPWGEYAIVAVSERGVAVELRRVSYDLERFARSLREAGFPFADRWMDNWLIATPADC